MLIPFEQTLDERESICIYFWYLKIYLNTVSVQQLELIFNGPCNYNKNIQFKKNVKPTTVQLHAMVDTVLITI